MKKRYIFSLIVIALVLVTGYFLSVHPKNTPADSQIETVEQQSLQQATLVIGDTTSILRFTEGQTLYDALLKAQETGLTLELKEYPGIGYFVTKIGPLAPTGDKYLMYSINGEEASVGISSYILKKDDVILWEIK